MKWHQIPSERLWRGLAPAGMQSAADDDDDHTVTVVLSRSGGWFHSSVTDCMFRAMRDSQFVMYCYRVAG